MKINIFIGVLLLSHHFFAQNKPIYTFRNSTWFESNLSFHISRNERFQGQIDVQYRRNSDASYIVNGSKNPFKNESQQIIRPWLHYWLIPKKLQISLSPFAYWSNHLSTYDSEIYKPTIGSNGTYGSTHFAEIRITPQIMHIHQFSKFEIYNRVRYEFRFLGQRKLNNSNSDEMLDGLDISANQAKMNDSSGISQSQRLRYQFRIKIPLNELDSKRQFYINTWNELFFSYGKYVSKNKFFNQNRFAILLGCKFSKNLPIKLEIGMTEQISFLKNISHPPTQPIAVNYYKRNIELNSALTFYLILENLDFFKKKN